MATESISDDDPYERRRVKVHGTEMAYIDAGAGEPMVFLHGNPTSSYLWRNVIPGVAGQGRCLSPDLIGMGHSGTNPQGSYTLSDHAHYLDGWFDALGLTEGVTLVLHDWGSILGFDWAHRHPQRLKRLVYMEAVVRPLQWEEWPERTRDALRHARGPDGEASAWEDMALVKWFLTLGTKRALSEREMAIYCRPFLEPGERRRVPMNFVREAPIGGEPQDVCARVAAYAQWLSQAEVPKLFINAEPGLNLVGAQREFCRTWPKQREVTVEGIHFLPEDCPGEIARHIVHFLEDNS